MMADQLTLDLRWMLDDATRTDGVPFTQWGAAWEGFGDFKGQRIVQGSPSREGAEMGVALVLRNGSADAVLLRRTVTITVTDWEVA